MFIIVYESSIIFLKMKNVFNYLFLTLTTITAFDAMSQDTIPPADTSVVESPLIPKANNLFNARLSFSVPNPTGNKAFTKSFIGIYQMSGSMNMALYKGVFIGVAFSNTLLQVSKNVIPNKTYAKQPFMNAYSAAVKIGGDWYIGENNRIIFSADVSVGQSFVRYSAFACKDKSKDIAITTFKSPYGAVEMSMIFLVEPNWGIGPMLSYSLIKRSFNPYEVCLDDWSSYSKSNSGATQYLSFGFVCYYNFFKK